MTMWDPFFFPGYGAGPFYASSTASATALDASAAAQRAQTQVEFLTRDVERLFMITQALWQVLKSEHGYDDDSLRDRVMAIHLADQKQHAGGEHAPTPCPQCGRPLSRRHPKCIYCGAEPPMDVFAR